MMMSLRAVLLLLMVLLPHLCFVTVVRRSLSAERFPFGVENSLTELGSNRCKHRCTFARSQLHALANFNVETGKRCHGI